MTDDAFVDAVLGSAAATIRSTFRAMEIAEEETAAAKGRHPLAVAGIHETLGILCPNELLREAGYPPYRAHYRKLLDRVAAGSQGSGLSEPTAAELCAALSRLSLRTLLSHDYVVAYGRVFNQAFPDAERADVLAGACTLMHLDDDSCLMDDHGTTLRRHKWWNSSSTRPLPSSGL